MPVKWRSTAQSIISFKILLIIVMLLDILLLLVIFIPISKWCSPSKHNLSDPTMDQGGIVAFKTCYLRRTFAQAIAAREEDTEVLLEG